MDIPFSDHEAVMATLHIQRQGQAVGDNLGTAGIVGGHYWGGLVDGPMESDENRIFWGYFLLLRASLGVDSTEWWGWGEKGARGGANPLSHLCPLQSRRWWTW